MTLPVVCPEDIDANGNVGTGDLLLLLSKYREDCASKAGVSVHQVLFLLAAPFRP